jgi:lipopolysaccharide export system protein LptA
VARLAAAVVLGLSALAPAHGQGVGGPAAIDVSGASRIEYDEATGVLAAEGAPVVVTRGRTEIRAPRIRYELRSRLVTGTGGVTVTDPELHLRAATVQFRLDDEHLRAGGDVVVRGAGGADAVVLSAPDVAGSLQTRQFVATGGVTLTRGEWTVAGRRVDYDERQRLALVTGDPTARFREATMAARTIHLWLAEDRARGEGDVRIRRGELVGQAPRADVSAKDRRAVLSGGARVDRGPDRVTADVIEVDLDGSRVTARGGSRLVITPR